MGAPFGPSRFAVDQPGEISFKPASDSGGHRRGQVIFQQFRGQRHLRQMDGVDHAVAASGTASPDGLGVIQMRTHGAGRIDEPCPEDCGAAVQIALVAIPAAGQGQRRDLTAHSDHQFAVAVETVRIAQSVAADIGTVGRLRRRPPVIGLGVEFVGRARRKMGAGVGDGDDFLLQHRVCPIAHDQFLNLQLKMVPEFRPEK
ncbi:hypothetical protein SDC9_164329 [bioreactor metagenome]|uniref:Uncharacterized protein n=1 Tax=bioreactor metagenome TaxID=1076179 RepID=A0A645FSV1_9ZZZZ